MIPTMACTLSVIKNFDTLHVYYTHEELSVDCSAYELS